MSDSSAFHVVITFAADTTNVSDRLKGINDFNAELYAARKRPMRLLYNLLPGVPSNVPHDGVLIIHLARSAEYQHVLKSSRVPIVSLDENWRGQFTGIYIDDYQVGVTGADYLIARGFESLAFCRFSDGVFSHHRCRGFVDRVGQANKPCRVYDMSLYALGELHRSDETPELVNWLKNLPKPTALMCSADFQGVQMIDRIQRLGMRVPEDIAVLSMDNNVTLCTMARPTLSSIQSDDRTAGYRAAALLYQTMSGLPSEGAENWTPPLRIAERESTEMYGFLDREVAEAYRLILRSADSMSVKQLTERLIMPRRSLELRFKAVLGLTPGELIRQTRLKRAQEMLRDTNLRVQTIARRAGFADAQAMARVFRRECGQSPRAYRRTARAGLQVAEEH